VREPTLPTTSERVLRREKVYIGLMDYPVKELSEALEKIQLPYL